MTSVTMVNVCPNYSTDEAAKSILKDKVDAIWHSDKPKEVEEALNWLMARANCSEKIKDAVFNIAVNLHKPAVFRQAIAFLMDKFKNHPTTVKLATDVVFKSAQGADASNNERVTAMKWLCEKHSGEENTKHTVTHHLTHALAGDPVKKYLQTGACQ